MELDKIRLGVVIDECGSGFAAIAKYSNYRGKTAPTLLTDPHWKLIGSADMGFSREASSYRG